jgi:hypothetical protein
MEELSGPERRLGLDDPVAGFGWMLIAGTVYLLVKYLPKQRLPILVFLGPLAAGPITFFPGAYLLMYLYPWLDLISRISFLQIPRFKDLVHQVGLINLVYAAGYFCLMIVIYLGSKEPTRNEKARDSQSSERLLLVQISAAIIGPFVTWIYVKYFD